MAGVCLYLFFPSSIIWSIMPAIRSHFQGTVRLRGRPSGSDRRPRAVHVDAEGRDIFPACHSDLLLNAGR
jgi:hypothetical protein